MPRTNIIMSLFIECFYDFFFQINELLENRAIIHFSKEHIASTQLTPDEYGMMARPNE